MIHQSSLTEKKRKNKVQTPNSQTDVIPASAPATNRFGVSNPFSLCRVNNYTNAKEHGKHQLTPNGTPYS
jgi:hypothetical protein